MGPACIMICTHAYTSKWIKLSAVQTQTSLQKKLCYEYVRVHFGFYVCSPSSTGICSLGMDPAMNLPNSHISHKFLAQKRRIVKAHVQARLGFKS